MVILLDKHKRPLGFTTEKRVRKLLEQHRACIYRRYPAVVILKDKDTRDYENIHTYRIKIDPGSVHTGLSVICNEDDTVCFEMQIEHHGALVKKALDTRRGARRNRRSRKTWYRRAKFGNNITTKDNKRAFDTARPEGWLPPSVQSIADNVIYWVKKLRQWIPITECSVEAVRFDTQLMDNPDIEGVQYQQGTLYGYEVKEYLLERYGHTCQYCAGESNDPILEWEHIRPKSRGGSDSVKNATLSCCTCNREKGNHTLDEWEALLKHKAHPTKLQRAQLIGIAKVKAGNVNGVSKRYAAWVNSSRRVLERQLFEIFGEEYMECSSGGRTKYNRERLSLPKDHHIDARCVGKVPAQGYEDHTGGYYLSAKAMGRGNRLLGHLNACGIITKKYAPPAKRPFGFATGDIVVADFPKGKHKGHWVGRVMVRTTGYFDVRVREGKENMHTGKAEYCRLLQRNNGYQYKVERIA